MSALDLTFLSGVVDHVSRYLPDKLEEADQATDPLYEKLQILHMIREERKRLQLSEAIVEAQCAQAMGDTDMVDYPDIHATRRGGKYSYKGWDHETLRSRIATRLAVREETGELDAALYDEAMSYLALLAELMSVSGYKVRGLRQYGIEFDDACVREPGRRTVEVQSGKREQPVEGDAA